MAFGIQSCVTVPGIGHCPIRRFNIEGTYLIPLAGLVIDFKFAIVRYHMLLILNFVSTLLFESLHHN